MASLSLLSIVSIYFVQLQLCYDHAPIILGAETLIRHFQSCGIPLAICTGSSAHTYDRKISKRRDLFSGFSHSVCSDDPEVINGKPSPDIYQVTAKRFDNHPDSTANVSYRSNDMIYCTEKEP